MKENKTILDHEKLLQELKFRTSRSSGPGGQNVNKVESRVELLFRLEDSNVLLEEEIKRAKLRLENKLTKDGWIIIGRQNSRSQLANKEDAIAAFLFMIEEAIKPSKKRKKVKPLRANREKRLEEKRQLSEKKEFRKKLLLF